MVSQSEVSAQSNLRLSLDLFMVSFGLFFGGLVALTGIWFWFDYQADPTHSILALLSTNFAALIPVALKETLVAQAQLMGLPLTADTSAYWYMARAGGVIAYLLMWLSVLWGLILSTKITAHLVPALIAYGLHEFLSILALVFSLLHAVVLLGDSYINFNIFHLLIPFTSPYEPLATGLGLIGFYLSAAITVSFYIRKIIGQKVWRIFHYLTFVSYLLILAHGIMAGTDTSLIGTKLIYWATGCTVLFLTYYRLFTLKTKKRKPRKTKNTVATT